MHFYAKTETGVEPRHFVPMKSRPDDLRPTRMSDVRKWWANGQTVVPSVTTILNVLDKAALVNWKVNQHLITTFNNGIKLGECRTLEAYLSEVKRLTEIEMDKAPSAGTNVHKVLEDYMEGNPAPEGYEKICANVRDVLLEHCGHGIRDWQCERHFTSPLGFGGCADLRHPSLIDGWVVDYKSKQTAEKFKPGKMVYPNHSQQLAPYRRGLLMPKARCANLFVCLETGEVDFHEHTEEQLDAGWQVFSHALSIWQVMNGYPKPAQQEAA